MPIEDSAIDETREAMDFLGNSKAHQRFILLGRCGGGYFAFRTAGLDKRVCGLVLLNVRGQLCSMEYDRVLLDRAMTHHYRRVATTPGYLWKNFMKVLRGDFDFHGVLRSLTNRTHRLRDQVVEGTHSGAEIGLELERLPILNIY